MRDRYQPPGLPGVYAPICTTFLVRIVVPIGPIPRVPGLCFKANEVSLPCEGPRLQVAEMWSRDIARSAESELCLYGTCGEVTVLDSTEDATARREGSMSVGG